MARCNSPPPQGPTVLSHLLPRPEDKKILEVAYQQDSKPDKQARLALVERVSLSEKEVQVRVGASSAAGSLGSRRTDACARVAVQLTLSCSDMVPESTTE